MGSGSRARAGAAEVERHRRSDIGETRGEADEWRADRSGTWRYMAVGIGDYEAAGG
jgi:hypothetical protein